MLVFNALERDPRVWKEAASLARWGAKVDVFMLEAPGGSAGRQGSGFAVTRVTSFPPTSRNPFTAIRGLAAFRRALSRSYDVVHCHDGATLLVGVPLAGRTGATLIYDAHEYFPDHVPASSGRPMRRLVAGVTVNRLAEVRYVRRADRVIAVTDSIARLLNDHYDLEQRPTVIRNVVPRWDPPVGLHRGSPSQDPLQLLFHGNVTRGRGVESCLDGLAHLPEARLDVVGPIESRYRRDLEERARGLGVGDSVRFREAVPYEELLTIAACADVGLYLPAIEHTSTSYRYSLPNKIFEYAMARLPMVVSELPEISAVVKSHGLGYTVDPSDSTAVAEAVMRLSREPERGTVLRNLEAAVPHLCWENEQQRLYDCYESALQSSS
jgi:glycosyltransferase involved in cell wall biosynthesis